MAWVDRSLREQPRFLQVALCGHLGRLEESREWDNPKSDPASPFRTQAIRSTPWPSRRGRNSGLAQGRGRSPPRLWRVHRRRRRSSSRPSITRRGRPYRFRSPPSPSLRSPQSPRPMATPSPELFGKRSTSRPGWQPAHKMDPTPALAEGDGAPDHRDIFVEAREEVPDADRAAGLCDCALIAFAG
jgi:hypothetical protein